MKSTALDGFLVLLFVALVLRGEFDRETKPHLVKIYNGDQLISSYETTNSVQVSYYGTNILTPLGQRTVMLPRTNILWTSLHIFR